jgi:FtsH-binding integral membrane protein
MTKVMGACLHPISTRGSMCPHRDLRSVAAMNIATIALVVLLVGYLLVRRMTGQLMEARRMLVLPAILAVAGLASLNSTALSATAIGFLLLGCVVGAVFGVVRGYTVRIAERDGAAWMRYSFASVGLWVAAIAVRLLLVPVENVVDPAAASVAGQATMLAVGVGFLAESVVVLYRAMHSEATIVWRADKSGNHTLSPTLADMHSRVREGRAKIR